jgi:hypothetical protein
VSSTNGAARAGNVLDDDALTQCTPHVLGQNARQRVCP